jgi:hypothetical protein
MLKLGAARSHIHQTTVEERSKSDPNVYTVSTSTCVSFWFQTPSTPSPFVPPPGVNVSAVAEALTKVVFAFPVAPNEGDNGGDSPTPSLISLDSGLDDYPTTLALSIGLDSNWALTYAPTVSDGVSAASIASIALVIPDIPSSPPNTPLVPTIAAAPVAPAPAAPHDGKTLHDDETIALDERWYCITVGHDVGVVQGW